MASIVTECQILDRRTDHHRSFSRYLFSATVLFVCGYSAAPRDSATEKLEVESVSITDKRGFVRSEWLVTSEESVEMRFKDGDGRNRMILSVSKDGVSKLVMLSEDGVERARLALEANEAGSLSLYDVARSKFFTYPEAIQEK